MEHLVTYIASFLKGYADRNRVIYDDRDAERWTYSAGWYWEANYRQHKVAGIDTIIGGLR